MEADTPKHGLTLGATRELLLPATLMGCFALYYFAEQPFWVVLVCALPMMVLYALAPLWAASSLARFDREAVGLLAKRDPTRLRARYRRALGLRLFAPPALRAERRAMVLLESGDTRGARAAYGEVLEELGPAASARVVLGYAHASFELGDDAGAIAHYRRVLDSVGALPGVPRKLAHALVREGEDLRGALALLEQEREAGAPGELTLLRALAHLKLGETHAARELVAQLAAPESSELYREVQHRLDEAASVGAR